MGTITRGTKAAGGTDFVDNTDALASEVNTDLNTMYSEFNGSIEDINVSGSANIDPSKIGDYASTDAEFAIATAPGDSGSVSLPTDLEEELARLRYAIERIGLGIDAERVNAGGSTTAYWGDEPITPTGNILFNGDFGSVDQQNSATSVPPGWTTTGAPTYSITRSLAFGPQVQITGTAGTDGMTQTFAPRQSTKYLVVTRFASHTAGTARVASSNADATSEFRDFSEDDASGLFVTKSFVIQSDATPTNIIFTISGNIIVDYFFVYELSTLKRNVGTGIVEATSTATTTIPASWTTLMTVDVVVGTPRNSLPKCTASLTFTSTADNHEVYVRIIRVDTGSNVIAGPIATQVDNARGGSVCLVALDDNLTEFAASADARYQVQAMSDHPTEVVFNGTEAGETLQSHFIVEYGIGS